MIVVPSIHDLEFVSFSDRLHLPPYAGVYFLTDLPRIYYIGSTTNLRKRWSGHHRAIQVDKLVAPRIYWLECAAGELLEIERLSREFYRPLWNNTRLKRQR